MFSQELVPPICRTVKTFISGVGEGFGAGRGIGSY